jgi:hypothetical protein
MAPAGISKMAYDSVNAPTTQPRRCGEMFISACLRGPAMGFIFPLSFEI